MTAHITDYTRVYDSTDNRLYDRPVDKSDDSTNNRTKADYMRA